MRGSRTLSSCMRKTYPTDLSDEEWAYLKIRLSASKLPGRLRAHSLRDVFDATFFFHVLRSGCPWRFLPSDFPPWSTVYHRFRKFRMSGLWHRIFVVVLRTAERKRVGQGPRCVSGHRGRPERKNHRGGRRVERPFDAHENVKGRKRHPLVDTLGLPLSVYVVTPADVVRDRAGARPLLAGLRLPVPNPKKIRADGAYDGRRKAREVA